MVFRKTKQGGISKGRTGAVTGIAALVVLAASRWFGQDLDFEVAVIIVGAASALLAQYGQRSAQDAQIRELEAGGEIEFDQVD